MLLAAIDTGAIVDDVERFVEDHPEPVYAGVAGLLLLLVGSLILIRARRAGDAAPDDAKPSRSERRELKRAEREHKAVEKRKTEEEERNAWEERRRGRKEGRQRRREERRQRRQERRGKVEEPAKPLAGTIAAGGGATVSTSTADPDDWGAPFNKAKSGAGAEESVREPDASGAELSALPEEPEAAQAEEAEPEPAEAKAGASAGASAGDGGEDEKLISEAEKRLRRAEQIEREAEERVGRAKEETERLIQMAADQARRQAEEKARLDAEQRL